MTDPIAVLVVAVVSAIVVVVVAWFGGKLIVAFLRRMARHSKSTYDGGLVEALGPQVSWLIAGVGFALAAALMPTQDGSNRWLFEQAAFFLVLLGVVVGVSRWFDYSLDHYVEAKGDDIDVNVASQLVPLAKRLASMVISIGAVLIMAGHLGIDVFGLTAALGLSGFAIALALKDTITNIFSGLVIMISRPFVIGDRIDVPSLGVWADVTDIGIRSSTVVTRDNLLVIVPNSKVVDDAVTNYSRPDTSYRLQIDAGLGTDVAMRSAQELIRAAVRDVDGVMQDKPVDVWFTTFADYSNTIRVRWWVESYSKKRASTDAVANAINDVAAREGISMPDPHSTLDATVTQLGAVASSEGSS